MVQNSVSLSTVINSSMAGKLSLATPKQPSRHPRVASISSMKSLERRISSIEQMEYSPKQLQSHLSHVASISCMASPKRRISVEMLDNTPKIQSRLPRVASISNIASHNRRKSAEIKKKSLKRAILESYPKQKLPPRQNKYSAV